ncbi:related to glucuronyl hydrolase [Phialocephala subalpina]|uniref:Related to glucuronyl hydrolase n=1 Tax=Phialocephala subalpina TaxID=576137 RepID=A0A1L7XL05_9HELO|nr:related to glucuronyl hydrolase [Phialocephala subalpina]
MTMRTSKKRALSPPSDESAMVSCLKDRTIASNIVLEPKAPPLKSEYLGQVTPPISDTLELNPAVKDILASLYSESTVAKIWGVAERGLDKSTPPILYPEYTKPGSTAYVYRELDFWTSGFFPGSLYLLLERQRKYARALLPSPYSGLPQLPHPLQLQYACKWWTHNLHQNAHLKTTHDLSFMISPWARKAWELEHDEKAYESLLTAAQTLGSRYDANVGCLRSWDTCVTKRYSFTDPTKDFLVIIDNMLNLDLLFWASVELRSPHLYNIAKTHARSTQKHLLRPNSSTFHVVNFDQATGTVKAKFTNQGYSDSSSWSRGQAWAIIGFAQTYGWTGDRSFLETARSCADYFLKRLEESGNAVPPWDFDAPNEDGKRLTDTSAAMIACCGLLLLHRSLTSLGEQSLYLDAALRILSSVCATQLSPPAKFVTSKAEVESVEHGKSSEDGKLVVEMGDGEETILRGATINNYEFAPRRWADHGLVYADYYFLMMGNLLLEMGIGEHFVAK